MTEFLADVIRPGTTRGLDFVTLEELRKRTGIRPQDVLQWVLSELLCNALDTDANEIRIDIKADKDFYTLALADNGNKKLSIEKIRLILDFENKASSKRGILRVSRGYLGNALKSIFGYTYALAESKDLIPPDILVSSGINTYQVSIKPNRVKEVLKSEITKTEREDNGFTTFTVKFPNRDIVVNPDLLKGLVFTSSMVNPTRKVSYRFADNEGFVDKAVFGYADETRGIRQDTSVLWYNQKQFVSLFEDFLRARPETPIKAFISMFRGFTAKKVIREILQKLNGSNHDCHNISGVQFFPATPMRDLAKQDVKRLYAIMKGLAKPISKRTIPKILGFVGEDKFEEIRERNGWQRLRYTIMKGRNATGLQMEHHIDFPFLIELAVFDRNHEDQDGPKIYECVNFMVSTQHIFSAFFNIGYRLGRVGFTQESPVTVVAHLVCPVLEWLNYGKSTLGMDSAIRDLMEKAFNKILPIPKTPRTYRAPTPRKPYSWVPHGKLGNTIYEERLKIFAAEIRSANLARTRRMKFSSRGWCYSLEGSGKIHKGEFSACQKAINDCRKIGLLPIDFVAKDQDETRRFHGIHVACDPTVQLTKLRNDVEKMLLNLPSQSTDYMKGEKYYLMMCVEKGDILNLFEPICREYHVPIINSKGWPPILLRNHIAQLSKKAEANGLKPVLLLFYDHDPAGLKITTKFRKLLRDCQRGTHYHVDNLVIDRFGLNSEDIEKHVLTWIENLRTGSGREARDEDYIFHYGRKKCECNALFKNDETLEAAEQICREAIEKYYGSDALDRFREKEETMKQRFNNMLEDPLWQNFYSKIDELTESMATKKHKDIEQPLETVPEREVLVDSKYYGACPECGLQFDYSKDDMNRLLVCRSCGLPMRLRWKGERKHERRN